MPTLQKISEAYYIALPVEALKQFDWGKGIRLITTSNPDTQTITISKDPNQPANKVTIFMRPKNKLPDPKYINSLEELKQEHRKLFFSQNNPETRLKPKQYDKARLELQIRQHQLELEQLKTKRKKVIPPNQEQQTV